MPQRKKNQNKENNKNIKRSNLQQINYTQQLRMQTTNECLHYGQSIELKKSNSKKPASRKSRCISAKQYGAPKPIRLKQLFSQFQSMKFINEKSKSPCSNSKSKPQTRKSNKKITQMNSRTNSSAHLTDKIERKINKLRKQKFFNDEDDSEIPLVNTSQAYTAEQQKKTQINIKEIRLFCNQNQSSLKKTIQMLRGNVYQIMARRIQRAWKRYRTHKLICRYAKMIVGLDETQRSDCNQISESLSNHHSNIIMQTQDLYPQQMAKLRKITHVSDLQQQPQPPHNINNGAQQDLDEQFVKEMKRQQLRKLNHVITLLAGNKKISNPKEKQRLLQQLMHQIQNDKKRQQSNLKTQQIRVKEQLLDNQISHKKLQQISSSRVEEVNQDINQGNQQIVPLNVIPKHHKHRSSQSSDSIKYNDEEFNCKKYIQYLDSDMYPVCAVQSDQNEQNSSRICKKKQNLLLSKLGSEHVRRINKNPIRVGIDDNFFELEGQIRSRLSYRSNSSLQQDNSVIDCEELSRRQRNNPRSKQNQLRKSNSQKVLTIINTEDKRDNQFKIQIKFIQQQQTDNHAQSIKPAEVSTKKHENSNEVDQVDPIHHFPDIVRKQIEDYDFQFGANYKEQEFERLYSEEELTKQLAELKRLRDNDSDEEQADRLGESGSVEAGLQRSYNQASQLHKINIQNYDHSIQSDEDHSPGLDLAEKAEKISEMVFHSLLLELLKEMARYPLTIIKNFKAHSIQKPRVVRAPARAKKNGFSTNQAQVKNFVEQLCTFLLNERPQVLKNLQKSTGPSTLQMLRYMHQTDEDEVFLDDEEDDPTVMVLPNWVFDIYWAKKSQSLIYQKQSLNQQIQQQRYEGLRSLNKIFYRSLFDCLNECLDIQRNFGPFGKPFPWKKTASFDHQKKLDDNKKSIEKTKKKLLEITATYCGIIIDRQQMLSICGNEEYLGQVQEDRLSRMLAQDLVEGQDRWIFYDDQQTQLLVETSNFLYKQLISEAIEQLIVIEFLQT